MIENDLADLFLNLLLSNAMLFRNAKRVKAVFKASFNVLTLTSLMLSQLSLAEIFLYQDADNPSPAKTAAAADADAWYDVDWSYRKEITIDHDQIAEEDLSEFPFLFSATSDDFKAVAEGGKVGQTDGEDVVFTLGDGTTKLSHELETYQSKTGKIEAWVKIPILPYAVDTKLYIYYGNATVADQQDKNDVWDTNYRMVQHLNESPTNGTADGQPDSTGNAMNGTADLFYDPASTEAEGKIGGADVFKDTKYAEYYWDDPIHYYSRVALPFSVLGSEESFTLSSWVKPNAAGAVFSNNDNEVSYCDAPGHAYYAWYLKNVTFNTINNNSLTFSDTAYSDYTNLSTTVQVGQTYILRTTNAPYQNHWIKAWVDFNQDGDFSDAGEAYTITVNNSYQVGQQVSITIPTTALNGPTRLRVRTTGWSEPPACGYDWDTETEDYTVNIQGSAFNKKNTFTFGSFSTGKFSIIKDGVTYDAVGDTNLNDSAWHYLSATYGAEGMKLYVDGALKGTNGSVTGALNPLGGGFWIGRYYDDRKGQFGFDGTIDEVRVSTSDRSANWIRTEFKNQNSPDTFFALAGDEARIMDHFELAASASEITAGESLTLTIRAMNNMGEVFVPYTGDKTLTFAGAAINGSDVPAASDKNGNEVNFGAGTVLTFADGVATTTLTLYKPETANLRVTDGTYDESPTLPILVQSRSSAFVPPSKPSMAVVKISRGADGKLDLRNIPESVSQIAVSFTEDFGGAAWEDSKDMENILKRYENADRFYIKFRSERGGVSDALVIERGKSSGNGGEGPSNNGNAQPLIDGDIVKTIDSSDVYIIKYKNGRQYKRLILSPLVFNSYQHLKWENLKVVSQTELDKFVTSNLVKETLDAIIYLLFPNADTGERKALDTNTPYDAGGVYEINAADRDSYRLSD